jgi:hypothetical protein
MVIVKVYGGLGNQMFQYAAGLALARRLGTRLLTDTRWFDPRRRPGATDHLTRPYHLSLFGIRADGELKRRLATALLRPTTFAETRPGYDPAIEALEGTVLLDGYWQSYRYFDRYEPEVRSAFRFPDVISAEGRKVQRAIEGAGAPVAVHVRRGDYVRNPKVATTMAALTERYYADAAALLRERFERPHFFVFSDDIAWCREHLRLGGETTFVGARPGAGDCEDMALMASCSGHVTANSSFSWWSAWLSEAPGKTVIAPARWFADPLPDPVDLIPDAWIRM